MKIFFIGQKGIPSVSGGVEKHVEDLSTRLVKAGHEVYAYTRFNYSGQDLKEYKGVKLISLPNINSKHLSAISQTFMACLNLIFKQKPDVIHFHSIGPSSLIWLIKLFKPKTPVIATFHTKCYYHKKWGSFARWFLRLSEKACCLFSDELITVSKSLKEYTDKKYKRLSYYIPNGVNANGNYEAEIIKKWGLEKDNYIVSVSRLVRHKGIQYLIKAYKNIETNKKLVIVGDSAHTDNYVKELKELAKGNPNIIFTGNQSGKALSELFSNAYLFVQPSESEGLSIALLEAMSFGKAVLVSDILENKEATGGIGFSFKNKEIKDLEKKLKYLIENFRLVNEKANESRERVKKHYNWENIVREILVIYNKAIIDKQAIKREQKMQSDNISI